MPNWCSNNLYVSGPPERVAEFVRKANGPEATYNEFYGQNWETFDDIRIAAIAATLPEPGEVSELSFHALHPVPDLIRKLGFDDRVAERTAEAIGVEFPGVGGYKWQVNNWGTKWGACHVGCDTGDGWAAYDFDTAWSPPTAFYEYITKEWPDLIFDASWREEGMAFEGEAQYHQGDVVFFQEDQIEYDEEEEEE